MRARKRCPDGLCRIWHDHLTWSWDWNYRTEDGRTVVKIWTCARCGTQWPGGAVAS